MERRPSAPEGAKYQNGEVGQGSQRYPAGYAEKQVPTRKRGGNPEIGISMVNNCAFVNTST